MDLTSSINTDHVDIEKVTYFVLNVIDNRPKREKSPGDTVCQKREKKRFVPTKSLQPDQKSFIMKIVRANLVSHTWVNCLNCTYQSLDPLSNGWIFADNALQPVWYEWASLPSEEQIQSYVP